jgi:pimeloyl-ACP methyl ester carboxylesterase
MSLAAASLPAAAQFTSAKRRPDPGPMPKNIHGVVQDAAGKALAGARVFIRDKKTNVLQTRITDAEGMYSIFALPPTVDYEVYAEYKGASTERRTISGFLNRQDNVLNFQLKIASAAPAPGAAATDADSGPEFDTFDLVRLHASFDIPTGVPAPIPSVLLLHGYGEDGSVWEALKKQLMDRGWAVMSLDLRGHGRSKTKNGVAIQAAPEWRTDPNTFPQDLDPALDWLKAHPRIDNRKIAVIGSDIGADLALIASGKFPEVRTVVALNPKFSESLALAGSSQDFAPRSALIMVSSSDEGKKFQPALKEPFDIQNREIAGGTTAWVSNKAVTDAILQWLQKTY